MKRGQELLDLIKNINSELDKGMKVYFTTHGITVTQLALVNILLEREQVKQVDLSKELKITPAAVSMILNRLENQNVIERVRDTKDKRVVYVKMTDWFRESHKHLDNNIGGFLDLLLKSKNSDDVEKIFEGLKLLQSLLNSSEDIIANSSKCPHLQENSKNLGGKKNER